MVLVQALHHAIQLDIAWFIEVILTNLHLVLMLYILIYLFMGGKRTLYSFLVFALIMWFWASFENIANLFIFVGAFLFIFYIGKLTLFMLIEGNEKLMKKAFFLNEMQGLGFLILFNIYMFFIVGVTP